MKENRIEKGWKGKNWKKGLRNERIGKKG